MLAEIITIGDEILIGQVVDTNSAFIATELNKIGVSVYQITSVQDDREHILTALAEAKLRADLILLTGGLGPTKDDITKHTLCEFFEDELVQNKQVLAHIEQLFKKFISTPISDLNRKQALVPSKAEILHNEYGTAPGMWFNLEDKALVSLPGVPFEMKQLMKHVVLPKIASTFDRPHIIHRTFLTYGLGESAIANRLENWEDNLPHFVKLAYLPNLGKVRLRLTAKGADKEQLTEALNKAAEELQELVADILHGEEQKGTIEETTAALLTKKKLTLATAESFTGGTIAARITGIPGASNYFKGTVVSYATEAKIEVLGVSASEVQKHSVVSEEVALEMAKNVKKLMNSDFAVSTTGNAGPSKGDSDAEVGTVFIGIAGPQGAYAKKFVMGNHRTRIVQKAVHKAFEMLLEEILKI